VFWWIRLGAGLAIIVGQVLFVVNLVRTYRLAGKPDETPALAATA
jgi:hypothetical protein